MKPSDLGLAILPPGTSLQCEDDSSPHLEGCRPGLNLIQDWAGVGRRRAPITKAAVDLMVIVKESKPQRG